MKYGLTMIAMLAGLVAGSAGADEGVPSRAKLNKLGLGSIRVASDQQGAQVRGRHFISYSWTISANGASMMDAQSFGAPLTFQPPNVGPQVVAVTMTHPLAPVSPTKSTKGDTSFSFIAGNSADVGALLPPGSFSMFPTFPSFPSFASFP